MELRRASRRRTCSNSATRPGTRSTWRSSTASHIVYIERCRSSSAASARSTSTCTSARGCPPTAPRWARCCSRTCRTVEREARARAAPISSRRGPNTITTAANAARRSSYACALGLRAEQRGARLRPALDRGADPHARRVRSRRRSTSPCTARWSRSTTSLPGSAPHSATPPMRSQPGSAIEQRRDPARRDHDRGRRHRRPDRGADAAAAGDRGDGLRGGPRDPATRRRHQPAATLGSRPLRAWACRTSSPPARSRRPSSRTSTGTASRSGRSRAAAPPATTSRSSRCTAASCSCCSSASPASASGPSA